MGSLLNEPAYRALAVSHGSELLTAVLREQLDHERVRGESPSQEDRVAEVEARLQLALEPSLRRVINATGVVLHTNLGRAPLTGVAVDAVAQAARAYTSLEVDLESGRRGVRAPFVESAFRRLTGAPAALAVNNNAGAVLLALTALCRAREVVVSRGEQVEIGGSFRLPDVIRLSGARLREVGTTNRTHVTDFAEAIGNRTAALMRVHTANYRVTGYVAAASLAELSALARERGVLLIDDVGSGSLDGAGGEPAIGESVGLADITCFSADKLFGGPQAGILLGSAAMIERCARHPLARALRIGKLPLAGLESTLAEHLRGRSIPVQAMLTAAPADLRRRVQWWKLRLGDRGIESRVIPGVSVVGGGSLPGVEPPTFLLALPGPPTRVAAALRAARPAVLGRVAEGACCLDPRTVLRGEDDGLLESVAAALATVTSTRASESPQP